jgi:hypothetical protein
MKVVIALFLKEAAEEGGGGGYPSLPVTSICKQLTYIFMVLIMQS